MMKKKLWVFGLIIMLSLTISSSVWADFIGENYISTNAKLNIHLKSPNLQSNGNFVLKTTNFSTTGTLALGTHSLSPLLAPNESTPDGLTSCYLAFFNGPNPAAEDYFSFCMTEVGFAFSDNTISEGKGINHNEQASIFGSGLFFLNDAILNPSAIDGFISIICDVITVKDNDTDLVTEIRTGSCKIQGGLPDVTLTPFIGQRFTFTATTSNAILTPPVP